MTTPSQGISPLRQRMMDDMRMRRLAPKTQANYLRVVREFTIYLGRSPDTATVEDLRRYQLHLVDRGVSPISLNAAITGLKFFFGTTLGQEELMAKMRPIYLPRTLPVILSRDEVGRLIAAASNLKHQTALAVAYGTGLRASEVVALKVGNIDSQRMTLRVEQSIPSKSNLRAFSKAPRPNEKAGRVEDGPPSSHPRIGRTALFVQPLQPRHGPAQHGKGATSRRDDVAAGPGRACDGGANTVLA